MSEEEMLETLTNYNLVNHFNNTKFFEALKCLLNMYNQEKEKNKELETNYDKLAIHFQQNHISRDKIRAKIEELNKTMYKEAIPEFYVIYRYTADVLEELLED